MGIDDIAGIGKTLEKLIGTVSEGVGVVGNEIFKFDAKKIKRIGEAEAEVDKQRIVACAEAKEKAVEILGRAEKRFELEQYNKQINLENIIVRAKENLEGKAVSEEPVEKDWAMKFIGIAQDVSREELQEVLAKILSGEIQKPGSFSYQTLEVVKYLSKRDLESFQKFVALSTNIGFIKLASGGRNSMEKYDLEFGEYLVLSSIGLFNQSSTLSYDIQQASSVPLLVEIGKEKFLIVHENKEQTRHFDYGLYAFSNSGVELRGLLVSAAYNAKSELYIEEFMKETTNKGFGVSKINR